MNLEQFATLAGVEIEDCDPEWGGRVAYKLADHPNSTYCGYRTKEAAYKSWLEGTFGKRTAIQGVLDRAREYAKTKKRISPYVIFSRDGTAYTRTGIYTAWRRACVELNINGASLKDLRAKHATDAEKAGYSVEEISQGLAHSDVEMTRVYLKHKVAKTGKVALDLPK